MIARSKLVDELRSLGVLSGTALMVHASLRKIGPIDGGADALLDALFEVIGSAGTLIMSLGADDEHAFDAATSPANADMGVLPEVFRQRPGTQVSDHSAARFGAFGPDALHLLGPMPRNDYYGPGGVLERFTQKAGRVLRLGADADTVTLTHWAEYLADVPNKRRVRRRYVRADIGEHWVESLDDSGGIADWSEGDYFPQILIDYMAEGHGTVGSVGGCVAELLDAETFVEFAIRWMERHLRT